MFTPARPQQIVLKLGLYGRTGAGKTFTALLLAEGLANETGKSVAVIDTEHGTDFYAKDIAERSIHPQGFKFDVLHSRSLVDALTAVRTLDPKYGVIIVDSITHLWDAAVAAYTGRRTKIDTIPLHAWDAIKRPYRQLMLALLNSSAHVIICGREKYEYAQDGSGELVVTGVTMRAERETPYEPHILLRLTNDGGVVRAAVEKDRTGILAGQTIEWPSYENICVPLSRALGGGSQAQIADDEEVGIRDAERLAAEELERQQQASRLFQQGRQAIESATTLEELQYAGRQIAESKALMHNADIAELQRCYKIKQALLQKKGNGTCK